MAQIIAKVAGREVIGSHFVLATPDEVFSIYPFDDDEDFFINIIISITDEGRYGTKRDSDEEGKITVTHRRPWGDGRSTGNIGRTKSFASDLEYEYYIAFTVTPFGNETKAGVIFSYMISREPV